MQLTNPFRSAVAAAFGTSKPSDPLQASRGDLREATARRLGVKLADRPTVHPDTIPHLVNRAARRAQLKRGDVLTSYSRQLTRKAAQ